MVPRDKSLKLSEFSLLGSLPLDIIEGVILKLPIRSIFALSKTNHAFNKLINSHPIIWKKLIDYYYPGTSYLIDPKLSKLDQAHELRKIFFEVTKKYRMDHNKYKTKQEQRNVELFLFAKGGNLELIKAMFLDDKEIFNKRLLLDALDGSFDQFEMTPLAYAGVNRHQNIFDYYYQLKMDEIKQPHYAGHDSQPELAAKCNQVEIFKNILKANPNATAYISMAASYGHLEIVKLCFFADLEKETPNEVVQSHIYKALIAGARSGHIEVVEFLLKNHPSKLAEGELQNLFALACQRNDGKMVELLFSYGLKPDLESEYLHLDSLPHHHTSVIKVLIQHGCPFSDTFIKEAMDSENINTLIAFIANGIVPQTFLTNKINDIELLKFQLAVGAKPKQFSLSTMFDSFLNPTLSRLLIEHGMSVQEIKQKKLTMINGRIIQILYTPSEAIINCPKQNSSEDVTEIRMLIKDAGPRNHPALNKVIELTASTAGPMFHFSDNTFSCNYINLAKLKDYEKNIIELEKVLSKTPKNSTLFHKAIALYDWYASKFTAFSFHDLAHKKEASQLAAMLRELTPKTFTMKEFTKCLDSVNRNSKISEFGHFAAIANIIKNELNKEMFLCLIEQEKPKAVVNRPNPKKL